MIEKIHSAQNNIIIFVSHNMSDVAEMADRVLAGVQEAQRLCRAVQAGTWRAG